jgi:PhoD related phosphatase
MDHWTHASRDRERTFVIRSFQDLAVLKRARVTFVSGDVHCCGVGYFHDPNAPQDPKLMFQIITSAMVDVPPSSVVIRMLHSNEKYWVPPLNSTQSTRMQSDTKEEMIELFQKDVDGKLLTSSKKLLPRRNYAICKGGDGGTEVWELCVEKGRGSETVKYGPIVIPRCA